MGILEARLDAIRTGYGTVARDAVLALVPAVWALVHLSAGGLTPAALQWLPPLLGPLVWRRTAPVAVFAVLVSLCTAVALRLSVGLDPAPYRLMPVAALVLLIALATVAAHRPPVLGLACAAALGAWGCEFLAPRQTGGLSPTGNGLWLCAVASAALCGMYVQTRRAYTGSLRERAARLEFERDQQARIAAVEERARIARELHDVVSHSLAVIVALADGAAATAPDPGAGLMRQVAGTGRQAIGEMGLILGLLRDQDPVYWNPQPGLAQLGDLIAETCANGLPARLVVEGTPRDLGPGLELTVYRIVQEALTNTRKHAHGATHADVRLGYRDQEVEVEIVDDGHPAGPRTSPGHGLTGMGERAAAFAGSLEAGPAPQGGWRVRVLLAAPSADPGDRGERGR
ncbi:histidine kinase [Streptacidiphilus sp. N1-10]|uniref:histidine kinase n=1 Tax=Streptacidiphilus jeojiensis TaxID=3229225 RepID=A0ABV6XH48_9ACTN